MCKRSKQHALYYYLTGLGKSMALCALCGQVLEMGGKVLTENYGKITEGCHASIPPSAMYCRVSNIALPNYEHVSFISFLFFTFLFCIHEMHLHVGWVKGQDHTKVNGHFYSFCYCTHTIFFSIFTKLGIVYVYTMAI